MRRTADIIGRTQPAVQRRTVAQCHRCHEGIGLALQALLAVALQQPRTLVEEKQAGAPQPCAGVGLSRLLLPLAYSQAFAGQHVALTCRQRGTEQEHRGANDHRLPQAAPPQQQRRHHRHGQQNNKYGHHDR